MKNEKNISYCPYDTCCHPRAFLSGISTIIKKWQRFPITTFVNDNMVRGFTLIELLVVVLIIGILSAIALPQYRFAVEKARAAEAVIGVQAWYNALQRYYLANGSYPDSQEKALNDIDITLPTPKNFTLYYYYVDEKSTTYLSYNNEYYMLSRVLKANATNWIARGLTCSVQEANNTTNFGAKVCKSLCGTSTLTQVWGSPHYGCSIKN